MKALAVNTVKVAAFVWALSLFAALVEVVAR